MDEQEFTDIEFNPPQLTSLNNSPLYLRRIHKKNTYSFTSIIINLMEYFTFIPTYFIEILK